MRKLGISWHLTYQKLEKEASQFDHLGYFRWHYTQTYQRRYRSCADRPKAFKYTQKGPHLKLECLLKYLSILIINNQLHGHSILLRNTDPDDPYGLFDLFLSNSVLSSIGDNTNEYARLYASLVNKLFSVVTLITYGFNMRLQVR